MTCGNGACGRQFSVCQRLAAVGEQDCSGLGAVVRRIDHRSGDPQDPAVAHDVELAQSADVCDQIGDGDGLRLHVEVRERFGPPPYRAGEVEVVEVRLRDSRRLHEVADRRRLPARERHRRRAAVRSLEHHHPSVHPHGRHASAQLAAARQGVVREEYVVDVALEVWDVERGGRRRYDRDVLPVQDVDFVPESGARTDPAVAGTDADDGHPRVDETGEIGVGQRPGRKVHGVAVLD